MKKPVLSLLAVLLCKAAFTQMKSLAEINNQRLKTNKTGLLVLGSWAAANIVYGGIAAGQTNGTAHYFHKMNTVWNAVNLGLASFGYLTAKKENRADTCRNVEETKQNGKDLFVEQRVGCGLYRRWTLPA